MQLCHLCLAFLIAATAAYAQPPDPIGDHPKYEFRAAWIATVVNLDWPSFPGQSTAGAQADLENMIEELHKAGVNAVHFQVRTEADALYDSPIEPWSYWLTGAQGEAPDPYWDPLEFAVEKAHERGMELHAWLNPYRADRGSNYPNSPDHVTNTHPEWLLGSGSLKILDPGLPEVRDHVISVFMDIATRYDVDGLHIDDYFYPYPPNHMNGSGSPFFDADSSSWEEHGDLCPGCTRNDWRRWNTYTLIEMVRDSLAAYAPEVVWGTSPFGIWKNGVPPGIVGLDAYETIFIDAVSWMQDELIDYNTPQLYWPFGGGQDYGLLAPWWEDQRNGRHFYPGHGLYRSAPETWSGTLFAPEETPNQIRFNRNHSGIMGSTFFRAENITLYSSQGFADSLKQNLYTNAALTPIMEWRNVEAPALALDLVPEWINDGDSLRLTVAYPLKEDPLRTRIALYRIHEENPDIEEAIQDGRNLLAVSGDGIDYFVDVPLQSDTSYTYVVTAVSDNSVEGPPSPPVVVEGRAVSTEETGIAENRFRLEAPTPNPSSGTTTVSFSLSEAGTVSLRVFDSIGREVARLVEDEPHTAGNQSVEWNGALSSGAPAPAGVYFVVLEVDGKRATRGVTVVR